MGIAPYDKALERQHQLFDGYLMRWRERQSTAASVEADACVGTILLVEHTPVYTIGKSGKNSNLLVSEAFLQSKGATLYHTDRGGDITFHGAGQIVAYPIVDLSAIGIGVRRYIWALEQAVIDTIAEYGIVGERVEGATGVWLCDRTATGETSRWRKICAIGVKTSHGITMHGLALNVTTDLDWFRLINPCGFTDKGVTSIAAETGCDINFTSVQEQLTTRLAAQLGVDIKNV